MDQINKACTDWEEARKLGLQHFEIVLPHEAARIELTNRLDGLDVAIEEINGQPSVLDPSGNRAVLALA